MSESGLDERSRPTSLESLRGEGAQRLDPVGFRYLEVLSERVYAQQGEVRRILEGKLSVALADCCERLSQGRQAANDEPSDHSNHRLDVAQIARLRGATAVPTTDPVSLGELNRYIQSRTREGVELDLDGEGEKRSEMKSVRHFRQAWSRICAEDQVEQAVEQGPENAGPLNSHMLVLRSLALMRQLSPDYLQRFLSHVDSLLWLAQVNPNPTPPEAKPARRRRQKT